MSIDESNFSKLIQFLDIIIGTNKTIPTQKLLVSDAKLLLLIPNDFNVRLQLHGRPLKVLIHSAFTAQFLLSRQGKSWNGAKIRFRDFDGFTRFEVP